MNPLPRARHDGLNVQAIGSEVLIFDRESETAHALNGPAAFVWHYADGTRAVDEIAREMTREFGAQADASVVWYALEQLKRRHLLEPQSSVPSEWQGMTRRQFLKRATTGAILLAVVASIAAPSPVHAQSGCIAEGESCVGPTPCCPGLGCCVGAGPTCETFC